MGATAELSNFVAKLTIDQMPKDVVEKSKYCLLDGIGVMLAASATNAGSMIANFVRDFGDKKESSVIGFNIKTACRSAALANGTFSEVLEIQDGERYAGLHPSGPIISAALAIGEKEKSTGKDLIAAITAGYDVMIRIGASIHPSHYLRGFIPTGTCGTFGAAAVASKLLGSDLEGIASALGIAGFYSPICNVESFIGYTIKPTHSGYAAQTGILAAQLAKYGYTASHAAIERPRGFCYATSNSPRIERITDKLGVKFEIMEVYFKPFTGCRHTHSAIEATLNLIRDYGIKHTDLENILVRTHKVAASDAGQQTSPASSFVDCEFSIPYLIAAAIIDGEVGPDQVDEERIRDPKIHEIARKVKVIEDNELTNLYPDKTAANVQIITKLGKKYSFRVDVPKGDPRRPLTEEELKLKFRKLAARKLKTEQIETIIQEISELEELDDVAKLVSLLRSG